MKVKEIERMAVNVEREMYGDAVIGDEEAKDIHAEGVELVEESMEEIKARLNAVRKVLFKMKFGFSMQDRRDYVLKTEKLQNHIVRRLKHWARGNKE